MHASGVVWAMEIQHVQIKPNLNWYSSHRKHMEAPQKIQNRASYDPVIPLLGIYPKGNGNRISNKSAPPCAQQHDSWQPRPGRNPTSHRWMDGWIIDGWIGMDGWAMGG